MQPFGDSYTDPSAHMSGGAMWPDYVAGTSGIAGHPFAVSGAVCSTALTPRDTLPVIEHQIPAFKDKMQELNLDMSSAVFTLWIGTNDLGHGLLVDGGQAPGVTIVYVARCGATWVQALYELGARNFISMNMVPLDHAPSYTKPNQNMELLRELVASGNELREMTLQILASTLPDAHIGLFDAHALFMDIINSPADYLNGTVPLDVTSTVVDCRSTGGCGNDSDRDSFLWNDDLHPSEQTNRVVAREMAAVISGGSSQWMTWLS
ncbi:hypothetical protein BKA62DRAFT_765694 [Auriculariales sp. MPI-PUGE-AT-0066]|nr:hypothetical protein BKA62DRAFT_765694 [Auriculariales sp. MPI-PUGE-AT-0066]